MGKGKIGAIGLGLIIVIGLICLLNCSTIVPAGYAAVQYNLNGGISDETLGQGFHITSPMIKTTLYSVGIEQSYLTADNKGDSKEDESFSTPTSDGKSLTVDLEFSYKFGSERLGEVFTRFKGQSGEEVKDTFIKPKMKAWTQEVTAKYPVTDVFGDKRQELNEALDVYLKAKFEPYGIIIDTVNFTRIETDAETQAAIQKKVNAQQALELAQIEAETAKVQAEKDKEVALIAAEKAKIEAEAAAEVKRIEAQAEAEANRQVAASLTSELIEKIKYEKWDGKLPYVQGSDGTIINLTEDDEE